MWCLHIYVCSLPMTVTPKRYPSETHRQSKEELNHACPLSSRPQAQAYSGYIPVAFACACRSPSPGLLTHRRQWPRLHRPWAASGLPLPGLSHQLPELMVSKPGSVPMEGQCLTLATGSPATGPGLCLRRSSQQCETWMHFLLGGLGQLKHKLPGTPPLLPVRFSPWHFPAV